MKKDSLTSRLRTEKYSIIVLAVAAVIFFALIMWAKPGKDAGAASEEYVEYEKATVTAVLSDNTAIDPASDNAYRGEQLLTARVETGQYKGEELMTYNYTGPLYGAPLSESDSVVIAISTHADGEHNAVVYEYNRIPALAAVLIVFFIVTVLIGGRTGFKSLLGLAFTILCLFSILIPMLIKGAPTILTIPLTAFIASALIKKPAASAAGTK